MVLLEKGQAAEIRWLNLSLMDQKQDWYLSLNPNGVVPTLLHGEQVLFESNVINEYLDAVLPQPALVPMLCRNASSSGVAEIKNK